MSPSPKSFVTPFTKAEELQEVLLGHFTLDQLYEGDPAIPLPNARERQNDLVERTVDVTLQIALEHELLKGAGYDELERANLLGMLPEKEGSSTYRPVSRRDFDEAYRAFLKFYLPNAEELDQLVPPSPGGGNNITPFLIPFMVQRGIFRSAATWQQNAMDRMAVSNYYLASEDFKTKMDLYDQELAEKLEEAEAFGKEAIRGSEGTDIVRAKRARKIENAIGEIKKFRQQILEFRDGYDFPNMPEFKMGGFPKLNPPPYSRVPKDPRIEFINDNYGHLIHIRETSHKSKKTAEAKLRRYKKLPVGAEVASIPANQITDINRITIIPDNIDIADRFTQLLDKHIEWIPEEETFRFVHHHRKADEGWQIYSGGYLDRKLLTNLTGGFAAGSSGTIAEIKVVEDYQTRADMDSHRVYNIFRMMKNDDHHFDPSLLTLSQLEIIHKAYNDVMELYENDENYVTQNKKELRDFGHEALQGIIYLKSQPSVNGEEQARLKTLEGIYRETLKERYDELLRLNQSIHIAAAINIKDSVAPETAEAWQRLYLEKAYERNARIYKKMKDGVENPGELIAPDLLEKIAPDMPNRPTLQAAEEKIMAKTRTEGRPLS